uniref:VWFA domain-containing protein n=1 Tax=Kalanchoe fedtschenkoi TaxID=63787 RepID=A0A7N0UG12_KALFE
MCRRASGEVKPERDIFIKHFKNIPMADMEIVFPEKKNPTLTPLDWMKFLISAVVGLVTVAGSIDMPKADFCHSIICDWLLCYDIFQCGKDSASIRSSYADERSWESLQEDESGLLRPIDNLSLQHAQYRRRIRNLSSPHTFARIQKGLIRYLYLVLDLSKAAGETDYRPTRMAVMAKYVELFIREFFDQNPLSQISLVTVKDGVAHNLTDLGGSPESHIKSLMSNLGCSGDASLQNALDLVHGYLNQIPSYGHREVLILYSALSTCDPGDIMETIQYCKESKIRCSVIGLSAEMFICKHLCQETGGSYSVALDESHFKELLLEHAPPPPAIAEYAVASLIRMGFPQRAAEGVISICSCHKEAKVGGGYTCPRCKARICEVPTECRICGLTLETIQTSPACVFLAQNANKYFALNVTFTFMRACTIARVARASDTPDKFKRPLKTCLPWDMDVAAISMLLNCPSVSC